MCFFFFNSFVPLSGCLPHLNQALEFSNSEDRTKCRENEGWVERTPEGWLRIAKTFLLYSKLGEKLWVGLEKGVGWSDSICLTITLLQRTGGARGSGVAVGRGGGAVGWGCCWEILAGVQQRQTRCRLQPRWQQWEWKGNHPSIETQDRGNISQCWMSTFFFKWKET